MTLHYIHSGAYCAILAKDEIIAARSVFSHLKAVPTGGSGFHARLFAEYQAAFNAAGHSLELHPCEVRRAEMKAAPVQSELPE